MCDVFEDLTLVWMVAVGTEQVLVDDQVRDSWGLWMCVCVEVLCGGVKMESSFALLVKMTVRKIGVPCRP